MATDFIIVSANVENNNMIIKNTDIIAFLRQRREIILYPIPRGKVEAPDGRFPDGRFPDGRFPDGRFPATKNS